MRVMVTGATGFVGRALSLRLLQDGHSVTAWVRDPAQARAALGAEVRIVGSTADELLRAVDDADAIVNLAGEPIAGVRWTKRRKAALVSSRIDTTSALATALHAARPGSRVLVSASAVGFYGGRADEVLDERSAGGSGFLALLCRAWETAALSAETPRTRVAIFRFGVVLGREGGALAKMLPAFRAGAGGKLGGGRQWMSWIHLDDVVEILVRAITDARFRGVMNATAPEPVTNSELTRALGRALSRPTLFPVPAIALRALFGESAAVLLESQRVRPVGLLALGHRFLHPTIDGALRDLFAADVTFERAAGVPPRSPYLARRRARRVLRARAELDVPLREAFAFFSRPENLGALTPPGMGFRLRTAGAVEMREGAALDYTIRVGPLPVRWRTRIERWREGEGFVDVQEAGPYASWWHEHAFREENGRTIMEDTVRYAVPGGPFGALVERFVVRPILRRIFAFRAGAIRLRFGRPASRGAVGEAA